MASAIAAVELIFLMVAGVALLTHSASHAAAATHHRAPVVHARPLPKAPPVGKPKLTRAQTSVLVLNGNGIAGAASAASTRVGALGYRIGGVGNTARRTDGRSVVMYRQGFEAEALRLGRDLHVTMVGPLDGLRSSELGKARLVY